MNNQSKLPNPDSELYRAVLTLKTPEECYRFLSDLCTTNELKAMEQRYEIARMLKDGKVYTDILELTGASSATVSRVNRSLNFGEDSYDVVFARLDGEEK